MRMEFAVFLSQKTAGRALQLHLLGFFFFFSCIFVNISTLVLPQHIQGVTNLSKLCSQMCRRKIIEKDKHIFFLV